MWKYFYSTVSAGEIGTLFQLRNVTGRTNVNADPVHRFNECDDFFRLVVTCHVLVQCLQPWLGAFSIFLPFFSIVMAFSVFFIILNF